MEVRIEKKSLMTEHCPACGFWLKDDLVQDVLNTKRLVCRKCGRKFQVTKGFGTELIQYEVKH